ncbi:MAG: hypothetical protein P4L31_03645 [Candidatus Babeliales bacterium]|nr:hypothetical protein [Candidatus Babeliales bacterium]
MKSLSLFFLLIAGYMHDAHMINMPAQTPWAVLNIKGYAIDPITGKIDDTVGFGAFDSIMQSLRPTCPYNFDNGGGAYDDATNYVKFAYNIENMVYDPFMREQEYNESVLECARQHPFDCCTSLSVLNVIDTLESRMEHISLCFMVLKRGGYTFFKVWPGDGTGIPLKTACEYQSNQNASYYLDEIKLIFGAENVVLIDDKTIKALKNN